MNITNRPDLSRGTPQASTSVDNAPSADPGLKRSSILPYIESTLSMRGARRDDAPVDDPFEQASRFRALHPRMRGHHSPLEFRVMDFFRRTFGEERAAKIKLPDHYSTLSLDVPGMARHLSLPDNRDEYANSCVNSYRLLNGQGVLHNTKEDRRTTEGTFHITQSELITPFDKREVPREATAALLEAAFRPPRDLAVLPYTADWKEPLVGFSSIYMRPKVVPEGSDLISAKTMETLVIAPNGLISNLDFLEPIFQNAGSPYLAHNDAALNPESWTGDTSYIVFAPHVVGLSKKALGLPHRSEIVDASDRRIRDGMFYTSEDELYNDGKPFKLTMRDKSGVSITLIADNYFGLGKKTVKADASYAANRFGYAEEEHSGGAIVVPQYVCGDVSSVDDERPRNAHGKGRLFDVSGAILREFADVDDDRRYAVDRRYPNIVYLPEDAIYSRGDQKIRWAARDGAPMEMDLEPGKVYVAPSGFSRIFQKGVATKTWQIIGMAAEGVEFHKPNSVSGSGKSELSKSIAPYISLTDLTINSFREDLATLKGLVDHDYSDRYRDPSRVDKRKLLDPDRSPGSVIQLFTPSDEYTDAYNDWIRGIPAHICEWLHVMKQSYRPEMGDRWMQCFGVDVVDGRELNSLNYLPLRAARGENGSHGEKIISLKRKSVRIGWNENGDELLYSVRQDYNSTRKIQRQDDLSISLTYRGTRIVDNMEGVFFQRPDDSIYRGVDLKAESDIAGQGVFLCNFAPLTPADARTLLKNTIAFETYSDPMRKRIEAAAKATSGFFVASDHPRMVDGKPTQNQRYQEVPADIIDPSGAYLVKIKAMLAHGTRSKFDEPFSVDLMLMGRRLNPPGPGIPSLAVYGPLHFQEYPELFMEIITSITGKSPSTTGKFSKERALTKGPFNAMPSIIDLNNSLVAMALAKLQGFSTAAGYCGPYGKCGHDITMIMPEVLSRMSAEERDPRYLIEHGYLEKVGDFVVNGETVQASRLGYRITPLFVKKMFGRVFNTPDAIFAGKNGTYDWLRPEQQDPAVFAAGMKTIVNAHREGADEYFADGSIELACPPLKALLHIMRDGVYRGPNEQGEQVEWTIGSPDFRALFEPKNIKESAWYEERLCTLQIAETVRWNNHVAYIEAYLQRAADDLADDPETSQLYHGRLRDAIVKAERVAQPAHFERLRGSIGLDPAMAQG